MHALAQKVKDLESAIAHLGETLLSFLWVFQNSTQAWREHSEVKFLTGKSIILSYDPNCTVLDVKHMIMEKEGFSLEQQRLIFERRQLEDSRTLKDYGIDEGDTVHLVLSLRGTCGFLCKFTFVRPSQIGSQR